ncbi:hypothetical protein PENTCL1PPCAC_12095, partial [Pristionchus entomophagus]
ETDEMREEKIENAMKAAETMEVGRDEKEMVTVIGLMQKLVNETNLFSFNTFDHSLNNSDSKMVWIRPVEVAPAVELLYIQYRTLNNTEAKAYVDSFLEDWMNHYNKTETMIDSGSRSIEAR